MHLSSEALINYADRLSNGAKMPRVNWSDLARYAITIPPENIALAFNEAVKPLIDRIKANTHHFRVLVSLRDTLLPQLISGRLRLSETHAVIQKAA
jgi:type I restriction enzyme S subunit